MHAPEAERITRRDSRMAFNLKKVLKALLLSSGQPLSIKDIQALAKPILRHRVMTNFYAESERINSDAIIDRLLESVPLPKSGI